MLFERDVSATSINKTIKSRYHLTAVILYFRQMLRPFLENHFEAGTDEAGRGCLAGPVTAAAVILPEDFKNPLLNDSKQLTEKQRAQLRPIIESESLHFAVTHIFPDEIDQINILKASIRAMQLCLEKLDASPRHIAVDGNRFSPYKDIPHTCVIKGDSKYMHIAAASVLAKTHRDAYMETIHEEYPMYNWKKNKGYPTKEHRDAIRIHGITDYHRKSFRLLPEQLSFDF